MLSHLDVKKNKKTQGYIMDLKQMKKALEEKAETAKDMRELANLASSTVVVIPFNDIIALAKSAGYEGKGSLSKFLKDSDVSYNITDFPEKQASEEV